MVEPPAMQRCQSDDAASYLRTGFRRWLRTEIHYCFWLSIAGATLYLLFFSVNYDTNGIAIAQSVESGSVISANHMLFELIGLITLQIAELLGYNGPSFRILQTLAAICGGFALGATYLAARAIRASPTSSLVSAIWLGTTWSFWAWSTN